MSPPLVGVVEEEGQSNVTLLTSSSPSMESICQNGAQFKERNYMGLSDCSSVDSSKISTSSKVNDLRLNLKATELRLGLPGSESPDRYQELGLLTSPKLDGKPLFPLFSPKSVILRSKRGFSDTMDAFSEGKLPLTSEVNVMLSPRPNSSVTSGTIMNVQNTIKDRSRGTNDMIKNHSNAANNNNAPAPKAQVVGWPPIRPSFRKNSLASASATATATSKNSDEVKVKHETIDGPLFVKVSMDGAPYLRKVDLRSYSVYQELSSALEKMFSCFTIGQYGAPMKEKLSETKLKDLLHGSEYVLTYEDKDGDWMLVGDVPWKMFISTCKRLRIMKSCDAIGLAPRAVEKSCNKN